MVWGVLFSSDERMLVSGSFDGSIRLWRAATAKEVRDAGW
jgi:WD40 repeat protein